MADPVDVSQGRGLPCRAGDGCRFRIDVTGLALSDPIAFGLLCKARIDHERAEHNYEHTTVNVPKARYDWGKSRRQVLTGQGI